MNYIILNFSHRLTGDQIATIAEKKLISKNAITVIPCALSLDLNSTIEYQIARAVKAVAAQMDNLPQAPDGVGVIPLREPGSNWLLLIELSNRLGFYPEVIRFVRTNGINAVYEVAELLELEKVNFRASQRAMDT